MEVLKSLFEAEDIQWMRSKFGPVKETTETLILTPHQMTSLMEQVDAADVAKQVVSQMSQQALTAASTAAKEDDYYDRGSVIRASSLFLQYMRDVKTTADKAALLSAACAIYTVDKATGKRLLGMLRA